MPPKKRKDIKPPSRSLLIANCSLLIVFCSLLSVNCKNPPYPSVASVSESWHRVKSSFNSDNTNLISSQIDSFSGVLTGFFTSPIGSMYQIHKPQEMSTLEELAPVLKQLKAAAQDGDTDMILSASLVIDEAVNLLWLIDAELAERSQFNYFRLFFFFSILVITVVFALRFMYTKFEKARDREIQRQTFSRETLLVQEQERTRIARELHDTVAQDLWKLSFQIDGIGKTIDPDERNRLCTDVVNEQKEVMLKVRTNCYDLIQTDFQRMGLLDTLRSFCYNFVQRTGIECKETIEENLNIDTMANDRQLQVFRIVQECFSNIEKHAKASEVSVNVRKQKEEYLEITITDNGIGFDAPNRDSYYRLVKEGHIGIMNLYERAAAMDGTLSIDSKQSEGTKITLHVPVSEGIG
jgi:signal transduction histidine kinase